MWELSEACVVSEVHEFVHLLAHGEELQLRHPQETFGDATYDGTYKRGFARG